MSPKPTSPVEAASDSAETPVTRRDFGRALGSLAGRGVLWGAGILGLHSLRETSTPHQGVRTTLGILRPPGAMQETEFLAACIRCTRCADACEAQCIRFFGPEAGDLQGTPYVLPRDKACTICLACGEACPTEALAVIEEKQQAAMGIAVVDERLCVSHNGTGVCGACFTICPLRGTAITESIRGAPTVHAEHCVGCGLCEEACIVDDRRAIQVKTTRQWQSAEEAVGT